MARNRQRAKQRQAERRARLGQTDGDGQVPPRTTEAPDEPPPGDDSLEQADLAVGAPPEDLGRSDRTLEAEAPPAEVEELPDSDYDFEDEEQPAVPADERGGRRDRERSTVVEFLINVWRELQRVQWPNRQQVTTLTAVVLGFVLIAGGYLGLLDAIFSRVVEAIL